jgi:hypothetical protein
MPFERELDDSGNRFAEAWEGVNGGVDWSLLDRRGRR